ncbi:nuclear transport factor 2 family protein [Conexibacter stalactiti]|uniref:Nuclear transport factor 2 family protein n=1 Tax=Conexibacter stalactiti TaxID=1940611 RepID=A0ABU4HWC4_9ACTN|nr:nuclear transport factor 2 family protein [Conexibacter stalactiti]MDW5597627.1 nuclear transport factor 2 family protein [Conexibacter stalactiti]MEC5038269.1 nuclear transport factor 2 family protein [Conexibacter stalactiti]
MTTDQTRALTERLAQARAAGDAAAILPLLTDDVVLVVPPSLGETDRPSLQASDPDGVALGLSGTAVHAFMHAETIRREVQQTLVDGDVSVQRIHMTGEFKAGGRYDNHYVWVFHWRDGRIHRVEEYPDTLRYAQMNLTRVGETGSPTS